MLFGKQKKPAEESAVIDEAPREEQRPAKRRKPQDRTKLTRNRVVQIRLTENEVAKLKEEARKSGMTLADFVMGGVSKRRQIVVQGAGELRAEIIRVGHNLNQALKLAYVLRKDGVQVDVARLEHAVSQVEETMEKLNNWKTMWDEFLEFQTTKGE